MEVYNGSPTDHRVTLSDQAREKLIGRVRIWVVRSPQDCRATDYTDRLVTQDKGSPIMGLVIDTRTAFVGRLS